MKPDAATTTLSTKGQVILPKSIRDATRWDPGTKLSVDLTEDGVLLRAAETFAPTKPSEVFGMLRHLGPTRSVEDMDAAIALEVKRRYDRSRY